MASRVDRAVEEAIYLAGPGNLGYTQGPDRWHVWANGHGDCASFAITVLQNAGIDCGGATYTGDLKPCLRRAGWSQISISRRHKGCLVLKPSNESPNGHGHVALCVDSKRVAEALANEYGTAMGGRPGDQTGNEVVVRNYNGFADGYYCFEPPAYAYEDLDRPKPPEPTPVPKPQPGGALMGKTIAGDVHRLYNPNTGDHLYTTDPFERDSLVKAGWKQEGDLGRTPMGVVVVYRLYNPSTGEHLWTPDYAEAVQLVGTGVNLSDGTKGGWQYEGEPFLAYEGSKGAVRLHRLYKAGAPHLLTADANEIATLTSQGWADEGVKFSLDEPK